MPQFERYVIDNLNIRTYTIRDLLTDTIHLLLIDPISGPHVNVQMTIAEVTGSWGKGKHTYVEFAKETFSFKCFAADWEQVQNQVTSIFWYLRSHVDVANPVELAAMYGGDLHGELLVWPQPNYNDFH